jgi:autotransporter-associated beta strand protein
MTLSWLRSSKNRKAHGLTRRRSRVAGEKLPIRLQVEALECRLAPAVHLWTGGGTTNLWSDTGNWVGGVPNELDAVVVFPGATPHLSNFDDLVQRQVGEIDFTGPGYTIGSSTPIVLTGLSGAAATPDVSDFSGTGHNTIAADLTLFDEGGPPAADTVTHEFDAVAGSHLILNGAIGSDNLGRFDQLQLNAVGNTGQIDLGGTGANTYDGQTIIDDGIVLLKKDSALGVGDGSIGNGTELSFFAGGTPALELADGVTVGGERLQVDSASDQLLGVSGSSEWDGPIVINTANGGFQFVGPCTGNVAPAAGTQANFGAVADGAVLTLGGSITEATGSEFNGFSVNNPGPGLPAPDQDGTVVLSGANSYTGPVTVGGGALNLQNNSALGGSGALGVYLEDVSVLQFEGGVHIKAHLVAGVNVPAVQIDGTGGITRVENVSGNNTYDGDICMFPTGATTGPNDVGMAVDASGDVLTLNGVISDFGSVTSITKTGPGDLALGTTAADVTLPFGEVPNTYTGGTEVDAGRLILKKTDAAGFGDITVLNGAALVTVGSVPAAPPNFFDFINIPNAITLNTTGADNGGVQLENLSGKSNLDGGVSLDQDTTIRSDAGTLHIGSFSGVGIGVDPAQPPGTTFAVTKTGPGTLEYNASNTYGGTTNVNEGTLALDSFAAGTVGPPASGAIPFAPGTAPTLASTPAVTVGDGTHSATLQFLNDVNQYADLAQLTVINPHGTVLVHAPFAGAVAPVGPIVDKGGVINLQDFGALSMSNPNTGITPLADLTVTADSVIQNTDGSHGFIDMNGVTRTVEVQGSSLLTVQPMVSIEDTKDLAGMNKTGTGTMDLQGSATYPGDTAINQGELDVDGLVTANVVINPTLGTNAILGGTGHVDGTVANNGGAMGIVSPAGLGATGTLSTGPITFASVYQADLSDTGHDLLFVTGVENLTGGMLKINPINLTTGPGTVFTILHATGGLSGQFSNAPEGTLVAGGLFKVHYTANDVQLIQQTVTSSTMLTATPSSGVTLGGSTVLKATVTVSSGVAIPAGSTVTFLDNGTPIPGQPPGGVLVGTGGTASFTASNLTAGTHNFTAVFNPGNNTVASSTSSPATVVVVPKATATVMLTAASSSGTTGSTVLLSVTVSGVVGFTPSGTVTITGPGGSVMATLSANGTASIASPPLVTGTNTFTATYSGDNNYAAGATATTSVTGIAPVVPAVFNGGLPNGTDISSFVRISRSVTFGAKRKMAFVSLFVTNLFPTTILAGRIVIRLPAASHAVFVTPNTFVGGVPAVDVLLPQLGQGVLGLKFQVVGNHKLTNADLAFTTQVIAGLF